MSTSVQGKSEPRLSARNQTFKCGYGPRSIRLSLVDRKIVFVGCKDGSVTKIDLDQARSELDREGEPRESLAATTLFPPRETCVRSLCDLNNRWLLLGQDDGQLSVLRWDKPDELYQASVELPKDAGGVGFVGRWAPNLFVASPRHHQALVLEFKPEAPSGSEHFTLALYGELPGVMAICGFALTGERERWIVCKDGTLWRCIDEEPEPLTHLWESSGFERPGYVYDIAVVRHHPDQGYDVGVYISTDEGVFLLRRIQQEGRGPQEKDALCLDSILLPGITDTCFAITHAVQRERCFLWVSDVEGRVHLFWGEAGERLLERRPVWRRSGLLEGQFPVRRALASWTPPEGHEAVVSQACRDDRIVISWYSEQERRGPREPDAAELLSWGTIDELPIGKGMEDWCWEARFADHIEEVGKDPEQLRRFLRNPGIELASSTLQKIRADGMGSGRRAADALTLWTHTLIATVHRCLKPPATQDYLGIIRWLRRLGDRWREIPEVQGRIEDNILYTRRWGVFGSTYGTRQHPLNALEPLSHPTLPAEKEAPERKLDRLVYESLIFRRRNALEEILPAPAAHALAPWELQYLRLESRGEEKAVDEYVAVSWIDGGTVYRRSLGGPGWVDLTAGADGRPRAVGEDGRPGDVWELGRRLLLGSCGEGEERKPFLLSAPMPEVTEGIEVIDLRIVTADLRAAPRSRLPVAKLLRVEEQKKDAEAESDLKAESVYGFLDLQHGRVAVGLKGTAGEARIGVLAVTPEGGLRPLRQRNDVRFPSIYPESKTLLGNPVWALDLYSGAGDRAILFLGSSDGQIWKVRLTFFGDEFEIEPPNPVGRLGAPVSALACRAVAEAAGGPPRVFAGGADGTVVAYQALGDWENHRESYATLWVTLEQGPVQRLLTLRSDLVVDPDEPEKDNPAVQHMVLAVTRAGRAILFSDRPQVERRQPEDASLQRLKVPGERLGRFNLGSTAFGAALLSPEPRAGKDTVPVLARLMVMPAAGGPRVYTLHYPKYTRRRHQKFRDLQIDWLRLLTLPGEREVCRHLLRQPETTYAVSPGLPTILVRWILPYESTEEPWEKRMPKDRLGPGRQWLPRHLRPLVELDRAWKAGSSLRFLLRTALLEARNIGDKDLFQEILEATLSRANHQLYAEAAGEGPSFGARFVELLEDIEEVKGAFEGEPANLDVRMRITIVKSLLDGDTLWKLAQAKRSAGARAAGQDTVTDTMRARIRLIHRSLGKGDLLLALETLRAANLALLRLCRRLVRQRREDWSEERPERELPWNALRGFFEAVGDFAARVAHPKGNLGEVAAHEICRAFALGMLTCPSQVVRLSIWVAEADLPLDTGRRIEQQIEAIRYLLGDLPKLPLHRALLRISLRTFRGGDYRRALFFTREKKRAWALKPSWVGKGNVELVQTRALFDEAILDLHDLARQLADDAGSVDIRRHDKLLWQMKEKISGPTSDQFKHSIQFWREALESFVAIRRPFIDLLAPERPGKEASSGDVYPRLPSVRPELVLFSGTLADWCREQRDKIRSLRSAYRLFEPVSSLYDEAFGLVEQAARRFKEGAAVQKNLVLGVLGHGLLELLDEHLLEVWEVAQALDPRRAWEQDERAGARNPGYRFLPTPGATSTAARFADYLLQRALKAEVIPKNLRSLQGLLGFTEEEADARLTLRQLVEEIGFGWDSAQLPPLEEPLDQRTYHFLRLTLSELAQNDRMHGEQANGEATRPQPRVWYGGTPRSLSLEFRYSREDDAFRRVQDLADRRLQEMIRPSEDPRIPSHGTGLYLANLAAGAVGWKLELEPPEDDGILTFKLGKFELPKRAETEP